MKTIKVCGCDDSYQVPIIFTFVFPHAEYWCPLCGSNMGIMGAGEDVPSTKKLADRKEKYNKLSKEYLYAKSTKSCVSMVFNGKRIKPSELPIKEVKRVDKIINQWKYGVKV